MRAAGRLTIPVAERIGPSGRMVAMDLQSGMLARLAERTTAAGLTNVEHLHAGLGDGMLGHEPA